MNTVKNTENGVYNAYNDVIEVFTSLTMKVEEIKASLARSDWTE